MKGILLVLVFLHSVLLNEAFLGTKKPIKTCPRNPQLDNIKKALGLKVRSQQRKRGLTFPIDCLHAGIVDLGGNNLVFHFPLHQCCLDCESPDYATCLLNGNPDFLCASRAYECLCDCRDANLGAYYALKKSRANPEEKFSKGGKLLPPEKKAKDKKDAVCKKKTCAFGRHGCCVEDVCINLFVHKKASPVRPR